jgi:hydrogenase maturation factor
MCITRVGKVLSVSQDRAEVKFFDGRDSSDVDTSLVPGVKKGSFVEVFGSLALSVLSVSEARRRKALWKEVMTAAMMPPPQGRKGK